MDKVLVLMSTYNGEKYLIEQLDSIIAQENVDVSILVRDDGSKDGTVGIVKNYQETHKNVTLIAGQNLGFAMSFLSLIYEAAKYPDYEYFAFSDQDDIWLKDKLSSAVALLKTCKDQKKPNLHFSNALAVDENLNPLFNCCGKNPLITKPTSLLRYFMLGCTMAFNRATVEIVNKYRPEGKILMHDLWLNQTCVFLGQIVYDPISHILYRQHGNNTAGVGNDAKKRFHRLIKSFKTYERRHFREINAKNLLSAYGSILLPEDFYLISIVANYKKSIKNRLRFLLNKDINMGSKSSDFIIKLRIILGIV